MKRTGWLIALAFVLGLVALLTLRDARMRPGPGPRSQLGLPGEAENQGALKALTKPDESALDERVAAKETLTRPDVAPAQAPGQVHVQPMGTVIAIDRTSGQPIEGATAARFRLTGGKFDGRRSGTAIATSGPDGMLNVAPLEPPRDPRRGRLPIDWERTHYVFSSPAHAVTISPLRRTQEARGEPLRLMLGRAATLRGTITQEAGAPLGDLRVQLLTDLPRMTPSQRFGGITGMIDWQAKVGVDGSFALDRLPPDILLVARIMRGGKQLWQAPAGLTFRGGEEREVAWTVGGKPTVVVRAVDESGAPAVGVSLALERVLSDSRQWSTKRYWQSKPNSKRIQVTDAAGEVTFEDVDNTQRWITIVNTRLDPGQPEEAYAAVPAPTVTPFNVAPGQSTVTVNVTVHRGAYIQGRIVSPDGESLLGAVEARGADGGHQTTSATTGSGFRIGPLVPGEYEVIARFVSPVEFAPGPAIKARTGSVDVLLPTVHSSTVSGIVVDPRGEPQPSALVTLTHAGSGRGPDRGFQSGGSFRIQGVGVEPFVLTTTAEDGSIACLPHAGLAPGSEVNDLRLVLGARTSVEVEQQTLYEWVYVSALLEGLVVASHWVKQGEVSRMVVPPGALELRMSGQKEVDGTLEFIESKRMSAAAGDTLRMTVGSH